MTVEEPGTACLCCLRPEMLLEESEGLCLECWSEALLSLLSRCRTGRLPMEKPEGEKR